MALLNINFKNLGNHRYVCEKTFNTHTFNRLASQYPSVEKFVNFDGGNRRNNQREHKKRFLSYNSKIKNNLLETSAINSEWDGFLDYLDSEEYRNFISNKLSIQDFDIGFEWSIIDNGNDLCPHSDCCKKMGTHLFFFPHSHWKGSGGDFVFLDETNNQLNPEIIDFQYSNVIKYQNNVSILFSNSKEYRNWHCVTKVDSKIFRRIFQVIFWKKGDVACYQ